MIVTIGIDPGLSGAIGLLRDGKYFDVVDIPTTLRGSGSVKYEIDAAGMRRLLLTAKSMTNDADHEVLLERVNAMPGQGVSSVFSLGDSFGVCRAVVSSLNVPLHLVPPAKWKKYFELDSDKEKSRALATKLFPEAPLHLKKHADRAEALLMARYLWETRHA